MKYIVTSILFFKTISATNPNWNMEFYATTHRYNNGDTVYVADGLFIDSLGLNCNEQATQNVDSLNLMPGDIMIYCVNLNDSEIIH